MDPAGSPRPPHPTQLRLAFGGDPEHPASPAVLLGAEDGVVSLGFLVEGAVRRFRVDDAARLGAVLARADLCLFQGRPLVLANPHHRALAVAVGPAEAPGQVEVNYGVSRLEGGAAVEIPGEGGQPSWHTFGAAELG